MFFQGWSCRCRRLRLKDMLWMYTSDKGSITTLRGMQSSESLIREDLLSSKGPDHVSNLAKICEIPVPSLESLSNPTYLKNASLVEIDMDEALGTLEVVPAVPPAPAPKDDDEALTVEGQTLPFAAPVPPTPVSTMASQEGVGGDVGLEEEPDSS
ncbi:hypothetical protein NE237_012421 [Protea cynaroides]|uniref:Uncharacterized protein n=1 Tax=Protea cynaroides TaxID=273540 RepID=A0A9Q0JZ79_9MAGN|nr:hypothetical protein NE237_012421 [Protea cynaroides]